MREILLLLFGGTLWHSAAAAQAALAGPVQSVVVNSPPSVPVRLLRLGGLGDTLYRDLRPTHWKEGLFVGAALGGVSGLLLGSALCRMSDAFNKDCTGSIVLGGVLAAAILAIPGALIGGQFPKGRAANQP